ncbi:hypothetical protein [Limnoglobus roseus]|nr:hypothetical protein [Limnoglobus roseus]
MITVVIPPAIVPHKLCLTFGQWSALFLELLTVPALFPKVKALMGQDEKAIWLLPHEVAFLQGIVANPRPRRGRQHALRCQQLGRKLRTIRDRIDRAASLG